MTADEPVEGRPDTIRAPWTQDQVDRLNAHQTSGRWHGFTCGVHSNSRTLVATVDGWRCPAPGCVYQQDWALTIMTETDEPPSPSEPVESRPDEALIEKSTDAPGTVPEPFVPPGPPNPPRVALCDVQVGAWACAAGRKGHDGPHKPYRKPVESCEQPRECQGCGLIDPYHAAWCTGEAPPDPEPGTITLTLYDVPINAATDVVLAIESWAMRMYADRANHPGLQQRYNDLASIVVPLRNARDDAIQ